eukprot:1182697-Prorocentrum_minimum.AAC.2
MPDSSDRAGFPVKIIIATLTAAEEAEQASCRGRIPHSLQRSLTPQSLHSYSTVEVAPQHSLHSHTVTVSTVTPQSLHSHSTVTPQSLHSHSRSTVTPQSQSLYSHSHSTVTHICSLRRHSLHSHSTVTVAPQSHRRSLRSHLIYSHSTVTHSHSLHSHSRSTVTYSHSTVTPPSLHSHFTLPPSLLYGHCTFDRLHTWSLRLHGSSACAFVPQKSAPPGLAGWTRHGGTDNPYRRLSTVGSPEFSTAWIEAFASGTRGCGSIPSTAPHPHTRTPAHPHTRTHGTRWWHQLP